MASELLGKEEVVRRLGSRITKKMKQLFLFSPFHEESKKEQWKGEEEGINVDEDGMSIVHYAAMRGNLPLLEQLLTLLVRLFSPPFSGLRSYSHSL